MAAALGLGATTTATRPETLAFTLPQAREIAMNAAMSGRPDVALTLTEELLSQDPKDSAAYLAAGTARLSFGDWKLAYRDGRRAFRFAETDQAKYQAARIAALAAVAQDRTMATQFWLRRAGDTAPTEVERSRVQRQFNLVKAKSPWRYQFDASIMPSNNVNGGSDSAYNIIDGVPLVGFLSPDAQALSGVVAQGFVNLSYRLSASDKAQTLVTAAFYNKSVFLSDEAKAAAPTVTGSDFSSNSIQLGLTRAILLGEHNQVLSLSGAVRGAWQGGQNSYNAVTTKVAYGRDIGEKFSFSASLGREFRDYSLGSGHIDTAGLGLSYRFANGNLLGGSLSVTDNVHPMDVFSNQAASARISFSLGKPVASIKLSGSVGASLADYPDYALGFIPVPGGRQDETLFADLNATFTGIEYAGFSPNLKVRRQTTTSNVSRFTSSEWAVSVGIRSNF